MKTANIWLLFALLMLSGCATVNMTRVDPTFQMQSLSQKTLVCYDSSNAQNGVFTSIMNPGTGTMSVLPDLDAMYAVHVFSDEYPDPSVYTKPILDSICDTIAKNQNVRILPPNDSTKAIADFSIVFKTLFFQKRVTLTSTLTVQNNRTFKPLAYINIDAEDKFMFGGADRFREAFENMRTSTIQNFGKDYSQLLDTTQPSESRER